MNKNDITILLFYNMFIVKRRNISAHSTNRNWFLPQSFITNSKILLIPVHNNSAKTELNNKKKNYKSTLNSVDQVYDGNSSEFMCQSFALFHSFSVFFFFTCFFIYFLFFVVVSYKLFVMFAIKCLMYT